MKTLKIEIEGMSCGGCVKKITQFFQIQEGIQNIDVSLNDKLVVISCDEQLSNMKIRNEMIDLGFPVTSIKKV